MTSVYAHPYPAFVLHPVYYISQMLESIAKIGTLPGHIFHNGRHIPRGIKSIVDRISDKREGVLLRKLPHMRTRVKIQPVKAESLATLHLVDQRRPRQPELLRVGRA